MEPEMTMLAEAKPTGHAEPATRATDTRLARIEQRLAEIAETGQRRILIPRDALADFAVAELAKRDDKIASLKKQIADLQQKLEQQAAIDQRVHEISARLEEKQERSDRGKNGIADFIQTMGMVISQERQSARTEFKAAVKEAQRAFEAKLAALEERLKGTPGKLPVAKVWHPESVTYQSEFVCHEGSLYQARKDTAQAPGGSDWICVARAGRDAITPNVRGTFSVDEAYERLDIVVSDGDSFIAKHDDPGICPGDGWQLLSRQGRPGSKGETGERGTCGERGEKGAPGPSIASWQVDRERYRASPLMSNGTVGPMLELRPLFEQFLSETS
jgi:glutathione S-transferase